ncbi:hypothetical protein Pcinc_015256 [Petrolisthes cinctipes]|uniref:Uncharacterized protein n=1 Tax=Petrolisthes cinctipes TaxID=88211 RepID=A0AAE1FV90_PETCI|nr:hypothetical protein Pcinc_015256 [Petrolisthes cinctipes]
MIGQRIITNHLINPSRSVRVVSDREKSHHQRVIFRARASTAFTHPQHNNNNNDNNRSYKSTTSRDINSNSSNNKNTFKRLQLDDNNNNTSKPTSQQYQHQ